MRIRFFALQPLIASCSTQVPLGHYVEENFTDSQAVELIDKFRGELKEIEDHIIKNNDGVEPPYLILLPSRMENSITI